MKIIKFTPVVVTSVSLILFLCLICRIDAKKPQLKTMEFFMHDIVNLEDPSNATTVLVAGPNNNVTGINRFGTVMVIDDPLTEGPSLNSKLVGRAQGFYITDSLSELSFLFTFTAVFPNNSTISFHGQDPIFHEPVREISIVGGTKQFRFITGYAQIRTHEIVNFSGVLRVKVFYRIDEC